MMQRRTANWRTGELAHGELAHGEWRVANWRRQAGWTLLWSAAVGLGFYALNSGTDPGSLAAHSTVGREEVRAAGLSEKAVASVTTDPLPHFPAAVRWTFAADEHGRPTRPQARELCQFCAPEARQLQGVDCQSWRVPGQEPTWDDAHCLPFQTHGQGEYLGPSRSAHVQTYHLRVNDKIDFVYRFTHEEISEAYRLTVGDQIMVETYPQDDSSIRRGDLTTGRGLEVQPDGSIIIPYAGRVSVAGRTIEEVRTDIERKLTDPETGKFNPGAVEVVVTPLDTNTKLDDLRSSVDARFGAGGQTRTATVTPDGFVQLVGIGSVPAQGLTIEELEAEVNARYKELVGPGVQVSTILNTFAAKFIWVAGEVVQPGQFQVNQPVTVVQAIALAKGFNNGGNVREVVVFRRDENWQLMATRLDVRGVFLGRTPYPSDDIWLRDNDVVVVPKGPILRADDFLNLVFTKGFFAAFPFENAMGVKF